MYGLLHDVNKEDLLDADGLLIDQRPEVRKKFEKVLEKYDVEIFDDYDDLDRWYTSAEDPDLGVASDDEVISIIQHLENTVFRGEPEKLSRELSEAGIPGHYFLDQVSRLDTRSQGQTSNIVMYQDELTYSDPETTDPGLLEGLRTGKPYRTVKE